MDANKLERAFNKTKMDLVSDGSAVFISTIIFSLIHTWDETIPTLCVNGKDLRINPDFFLNGLDISTRKSALAHEAWHIAFKHVLRANGTNFQKYNRAADYVINIMLKDAGYKIPNEWLCDAKYRDMSTEQVFQILPDEPDKPNPQEGDFEQSDAQEEERAVNSMLIRANTINELRKTKASSKGLPGEVQIHIDALLKPKLKPAHIFRNILNGVDKQDYTFKRPNRRFMPEFYLPSLYSESVGEIAVAVDASGSVSDHDFLACASEIDNFIRRVKPSKTTVVSFDTTIRDVYKLSEGQSVSGLKFKGRGGTDLQPVFDHFNKSKPKILVIFSDLWCDEIRVKPSYPVVWICCSHPEARVHFGTKIDYEP